MPARRPSRHRLKWSEQLPCLLLPFLKFLQWLLPMSSPLILMRKLSLPLPNLWQPWLKRLATSHHQFMML
jgi:hypothetical protein